MNCNGNIVRTFDALPREKDASRDLKEDRDIRQSDVIKGGMGVSYGMVVGP